SSDAAKYDVRGLEREFGGIEIVTIAENDDGELLPGETLDGGAETGSGARVPHARPALVGIEEPAEAIKDGFPGREIVVIGFRGPPGGAAIRKLDGRERGGHF